MKALEGKLRDIREEVIAIHNLAKKSVELCLYGLEGSENAKKKVIHIEQVVDNMNTSIDCECISSVALFQPLARDLRFLLSMIRVAGNYERITDLSREIASYTAPSSISLDMFVKMRDSILQMFDMLYRTLVTGKTDNLKENLVKLDDKIDFYHVKSIEFMVNQKIPDDFGDMIDMAFVSDRLERIGDILTKTGSRYVFIEEGRRIWIK